MFSWFGKKPKIDDSSTVPARKPPAEIVKGRIAFSSAQRSWEEEFDVVDGALKVLTQEGIFATRTGDILTLDTSEYSIRPFMVSFKPLEAGKGTQTSTIVRIVHPQLISGEFFEFQHSVGSTLDESLTKGFETWVKTDLIPLLDALEAKPQRCTTLQMDLPEKDGRLARTRRVILGPVAHLRKNNPAPTDEPEEHPFCTCCLLTNSMQAFMPTIETDGFFGVRMFAMRNKDGSVSADCRINGQEFEPGKAALRTYIAKWPGNGFEFRNQYVIVQNAPGESP